MLGCVKVLFTVVLVSALDKYGSASSIRGVFAKGA